MNLIIKKIIHILLGLLLTFAVYSQSNTFYMADADSTYDGMNTASDSNDGSFQNPWATIMHAKDEIAAGDTLWIRGGLYTNVGTNYGIRPDSSGTAWDNMIYIWNYPDETPIFDFSSRDTSLGYNRGFTIWQREYIHLKGLELRNLKMGGPPNATNCSGIDATLCGYLIFENMVLRDMDGDGIVTVNFWGDIYYTNCDCYNMCDSLRTPIYPDPGSAGQLSSGFSYGNVIAYGEYTTSSRLFISGCRAWKISDNGIGGQSNGFVHITNSWMFNNGRLSGEGCGFKYASQYGGANYLDTARIIRNNISAFNYSYGFSPNLNGSPMMNWILQNNTAYHNGYRPENGWNWAAYGAGFILQCHLNGDTLLYQQHTNNLSYDNDVADLYSSACAERIYIHTYNSWNDPPNPTITDADFVLTDSASAYAELSAARKADHSLPDLTFLKLAEGSDLIDAGTDVGLPYNGSAPDLGYAESNYGSRRIPHLNASQKMYLNSEGKPLYIKE